MTMSGVDFKALNEVTAGCKLRVVSLRRGRCVVWFGGSSFTVYDLQGGHVDTISCGMYGGPAARRREALKLLGGEDDGGS